MLRTTKTRNLGISLALAISLGFAGASSVAANEADGGLLDLDGVVGTTVEETVGGDVVGDTVDAVVETGDTAEGGIVTDTVDAAVTDVVDGGIVNEPLVVVDETLNGGVVNAPIEDVATGDILTDTVDAVVEPGDVLVVEHVVDGGVVNAPIESGDVMSVDDSLTDVVDVGNVVDDSLNGGVVNIGDADVVDGGVNAVIGSLNDAELDLLNDGSLDIGNVLNGGIIGLDGTETEVLDGGILNDASVDNVLNGGLVNVDGVFNGDNDVLDLDGNDTLNDVDLLNGGVVNVDDTLNGVELLNGGDVNVLTDLIDGGINLDDVALVDGDVLTDVVDGGVLNDADLLNNVDVLDGGILNGGILDGGVLNNVIGGDLTLIGGDVVLNDLIDIVNLELGSGGCGCPGGDPINDGGLINIGGDVIDLGTIIGGDVISIGDIAGDITVIDDSNTSTHTNTTTVINNVNTVINNTNTNWVINDNRQYHTTTVVNRKLHTVAANRYRVTAATTSRQTTMSRSGGTVLRYSAASKGQQGTPVTALPSAGDGAVVASTMVGAFALTSAAATLAGLGVRSVSRRRLL